MHGTIKGNNNTAAAAIKHMEQTTINVAAAAVERAEQAVSVAAAASIRREQDRRGPAAAAGDRRLRQRASSSGCKRSSRPALMAVAVTMSVLSMMMVTKAGAQAAEMASSDCGGYRSGWAEHEDGYGSCGDTIMPRVELYDIKVQKWQKVERNRVQRFEAKNNDDFVSKLSKLQQTIDQIGRQIQQQAQAMQTCGQAETEMGEKAEARLDRAGGAEETLQIMQEVNLDMRSKLKKQETTVNLS